MCSKKSSGARIEPWGTPALVGTHGKVVNFYSAFVVTLWPYDLGARFTIRNCLFGVVKLTEYADIDKYGYSCCDKERYVVFSIKNHCECYKKLESRLWPVLFTLTNFFSLRYTPFCSKIKSCDCCFPQQMRPSTTVHLCILQYNSSVRLVSI